MPSFNKVIFAGHLTRDPTVKFLPSQTPVAEWGMAANRKYKTASGEQREEVCFIDCAAFGNQADVLSKYCKKGSALLVEGRLKFDQWDAKDGGGKRSKLSVIVDRFVFLSSAKQEDGDGDDSAPQQSRKPSQRPPAESPFEDEQRFNEADIPF